MEKEIIKIRKKSYEIKKILELSGDMLVPDTKPDIINSVGANGNCVIKKEDISDGKIRLEGCFIGNIIYLSDLGETKSLRCNLDFLESLEQGEITSKDELEYKSKIIKIETKILNERKINTIVEIEITVCGFKFEEIQMISNFENDNIEKLEKTIITRRYLNSNFTKTTISEDVNFSESGKTVEILKTDLNVVNIEKKISYNKVLAKAEAKIKILYLCESQIKKFETQIPIMSFIEMENVKEENIIDLDYKIRKFNISNDVLEKNTIGCDLEFEINCSMYEKKEITLIQDIYSLDKEVKFNKQEVNMECIKENTNELYEFSEKINLDAIKEIYEYEYDIKKMNISNSKSCEGSLNIIIYYSKEENNSLMIKNIEIPFILKNIANDSIYRVCNCDVKLNNNEVVCNFKIECIENIKYEKVEILNECEVFECTNDENYSMVIYLVKPNDTIWNIAKNFKISMEQIINLNKIENPDKIKPGEKLYIMKG
ncbi:MAG: LysM peptidoglycan-binding domain-containing protein [Clostridia bacterium]|nr:LysM peptidoglycan-binding domain-containing protein [Clostridia bacterium]